MILAIFLATASITSTRGPNGWDYYGSGDASCGQWTSAKELGSSDYNRMRAWVAGFISGVNRAKRRDILAKTDLAGGFAWIDNYCAANPLKSVADASEALAAEVKGLP